MFKSHDCIRTKVEREMIRRSILIVETVDYKNDFIATGPFPFQLGKTYYAELRPLSVWSIIILRYRNSQTFPLLGFSL